MFSISIFSSAEKSAETVGGEGCIRWLYKCCLQHFFYLVLAFNHGGVREVTLRATPSQSCGFCDRQCDHKPNNYGVCFGLFSFQKHEHKKMHYSLGNVLRSTTSSSSLFISGTTGATFSCIKIQQNEKSGRIFLCVPQNLDWTSKVQ